MVVAYLFWRHNYAWAILGTIPNPSQFIWFTTFTEPETKASQKNNHLRTTFTFLSLPRNTSMTGNSIQNPCIIIHGYIKYVWILIRYDNVSDFTPLRAKLVAKFSNQFGDKLGEKFCYKLGKNFVTNWVRNFVTSLVFHQTCWPKWWWIESRDSGKF